MSKREDYEHLKTDIDGSKYWVTNSDVNIKPFDETLSTLRDWFETEEINYKKSSPYFKGTRLYFTYEGNKYYLHWVFYGEKLIKDAITRLRGIGASNIAVNYGELD